MPPVVGWGQHLGACLAARDTGLLDVLALAAILISLLRWWAALTAADAGFMAAAAVAHCGMAAWRQCSPDSWARWREPPAAALRVAVAAPAGWAVTKQVLSEPPPYGASLLWSAAVFLLALAFCSCGATGSILALARPLRLAWHVPAQLATLLLVWRRNADICGTPALRHPAAQRATAAAYAALSALPAAVAPLPQHGPAGRCRAVLTLAELLLGFLAPTLVLAASEAALYQRYNRRWLKWQHDAQLASAAAGPSTSAAAAGAAATEAQAPPLPQPPGRLAARGYELLLACLQLGGEEPADLMLVSLTATLLLFSTWRAILALTPA